MDRQGGLGIQVTCDRLADVLTGLSRLVGDDPSIRSVDLNPLIVAEGIPIAVDALVNDNLNPVFLYIAGAVDGFCSRVGRTGKEPPG